MNARDRAVAARAASLLLRYPDPQVLTTLPVVAEAVSGLGGPAGAALRRVAGYRRDTPPQRLAAGYVATFDFRRRCCLHLTYYTDGDTRRRGAALVEFSAAYRRAGLAVDGGELPDYLPAVLELASVHEAGWELLRGHRVGLDLLEKALAAERSPYRDAVTAVCHLLPPAGAAEHAAALRLAAQGPPAEQVGLSPFALALTAGAPDGGGDPDRVPGGGRR